MMIAQALVRVPTQEFRDDVQYRPMIHRIVSEIANVAGAENVRLVQF